MVKQKKWTQITRIIAGIGVLAIIPAYGVTAERFTSPSSIIDASVGNTFGGTTTSADYKMVSSGGETIVGNGSGGSYRLTQGYVAQLEKSLQLTVQPNGLAAYYPMDEGLGATSNDATANDNRAGMINAPSWTTGKVGRALSFNGINQYLNAPHATTLNSASVTVSLWFTLSAAVDCDANNNWRSLIKKSASSAATTDGWDVVLEQDGGIQFDVGLGGSSSRLYAWPPGDYGVEQGVPLHLSFTYDAATGDQKAYADGIEMASKTNSPTSIVNNTAPLTIARGSNEAACPNQNGHSPGTYDEIKVFSRALTANEIKAEFDSSNDGIPAGLALADSLVAGAPQTMAARTVVQTDAPGYNLAISQNQNLTSGGNSIGPISNGGSIATPAAWTNGTTTGLGFSLAAASSGLDGKWGAGANYAPLPASPITFYTRSGYTAGAKDTIDIRYKLDIPVNQQPGVYTNTVTYTGTMVP